MRQIHYLKWLGFFACGSTLASAFNMSPGVTLISREIYQLHMTILTICAVIALLVYGVMIYSIIFHRKARGHKAHHFHESLTVEILWTTLPFLILVAMAIPASRVLLVMENTENADITIKVTGYQWKWHYDYIHEGVHFFSTLSTPQEEIQNKAPKNPHYLLEVDKPIVVPVGKKIRFLTTANDVIHSWWVPALGIKKDAIPGFINEAWARIDTPGIYRGQCAELCGAMHGFMPIVVHAVDEESYAQWITEQRNVMADKHVRMTWTHDDLMVEGEKLYRAVCAMCHKESGLGEPPTYPNLVTSPIVHGALEDHIDIILHGRTNTSMQAFKNQLDDTEIAALLTYQRSTWGDTAETIQPETVHARRTLAPETLKEE